MRTVKKRARVLQIARVKATPVTYVRVLGTNKYLWLPNRLEDDDDGGGPED